MNPTKVTDEKIWEELHQIRNSLHALWNLIRGESPERINKISSALQFPQQAPISGDKHQADVSLLDILLNLAENACNTSAICQKIDENLTALTQNAQRQIELQTATLDQLHHVVQSQLALSTELNTLRHQIDRDTRLIFDNMSKICLEICASSINIQRKAPAYKKIKWDMKAKIKRIAKRVPYAREVYRKFKGP